MTDIELQNLSDRDLLLITVTDLRWLKSRLGSLEKGFNDAAGEVKEHVQRLSVLEEHAKAVNGTLKTLTTAQVRMNWALIGALGTVITMGVGILMKVWL